MKKIYINEEIKNINLGDSLIMYFNWTSSNLKKLEVTIDWCGQIEFVNIYDFNNIDTKIILEDILNFDLKVNFQEDSMGALQIYEFYFEKDEKSNYNVYFDLITNSNNFLKITCRNFYFEIIEKPKPINYENCI